MKLKKFASFLDECSDEEALIAFGLLMRRVHVSSNMVQNEKGWITHEAMVVTSGDKMMVSDPQELDWPLQPLPVAKGTPTN